MELVFTPQQSGSRVSNQPQHTTLVWKAGEIGHQGYTADGPQHDGSIYQFFSCYSSKHCAFSRKSILGILILISSWAINKASQVV